MLRETSRRWRSALRRRRRRSASTATTSRPPTAGRAGSSCATASSPHRRTQPLERGHHARRPARRAPRQLPRHLARDRPATRAQLPERGARYERHLALHFGLRLVDAVASPATFAVCSAVPAGDPEHRPLGPVAALDGRRGSVGDPAGRRRARRARDRRPLNGCLKEAPIGAELDAARDPSGPTGREITDVNRRRPGARPQRRARSSRSNEAFAPVPARAPQPAHRRRAACERPRDPRRDRRPPAEATASA